MMKFILLGFCQIQTFNFNLVIIDLVLKLTSNQIFNFLYGFVIYSDSIEIKSFHCHFVLLDYTLILKLFTYQTYFDFNLAVFDLISVLLLKLN